MISSHGIGAHWWVGHRACLGGYDRYDMIIKSRGVLAADHLGYGHTAIPCVGHNTPANS